MAPPEDTYTHGHHASVLASHRWRTVDNSAAYLIPHLVEDAVLLDVGCGPGTITLDLAQRLNAGMVIGFDRAGDVLDAARVDAAAAGVVNVEFKVGDVYGIEADGGTYDIVHAHQVLQHLSDPVAALIEMRRVCRPDGVVAARDSDYSAMTWFPAHPGLDRWLKLYLSLARANHAEPDAGRHLRSWAMRAGFTSVESSGSVWCYSNDAERVWWSNMWADRVVESDFATQALERGAATVDDLGMLAEAWREWGRSADGWFTVLHGEVLCRG